MQGIKLKNIVLDTLNDLTEGTGGKGTNCVLDYIWKKCMGQPGFKRYSKQQLEDELRRFVLNLKKGISTN